MELLRKLTRCLKCDDVIKVIKHFNSQLEVNVNVVLSDAIEFTAFQNEIAREPRVSVVKVELRHQELRVLLDAEAIAIVEVTPKLSHFSDHVSVAHRMLDHKVMAFSQKLVKDMAEFPGSDAVVLQGLTDSDRPESVTSVRVICPDDCSSNML